LQIVVNNKENAWRAFEISAKNGKNRENNKRKQAGNKRFERLYFSTRLMRNSVAAR
jgi:hypothetical protein